MLVGWAFLPVSELENTNSDGQECPSYESLKTQHALRSDLARIIHQPEGVSLRFLFHSTIFTQSGR